MTNFEQYDEYIEKLLYSQFDVAEIIEHLLTRGEVREEFLIDSLSKEFDHPRICRGFLMDFDDISNQCDILIYKAGARTRNIGNNKLIQPTDCHMVIEVKSRLAYKDLKEFNIKAQRIKSMCNPNQQPPICGIFAYNIVMPKNNILSRFGLVRETETDSYKTDEEKTLQYPFIDFITSIHRESWDDIDTSNHFFLIKDMMKGYQYFCNYPIISNFIGLVQSFLST